MSQRLTVGLGIGALIAGAVGVLAPQAAAKDLAPGVSCGDNGFCRNDTDDIYYITGQVTCSGFPGSVESFSGYAGRHSTDPIPMSCPSDYTPGTMEQGPPTIGPDGAMQMSPPTQSPGTWTNNYPVSIDWQTATVDNDQKLQPHTGSS